MASQPQKEKENQRLVIISNRLPITCKKVDGEWQFSRSSGGKSLTKLFFVVTERRMRITSLLRVVPPVYNKG